MPPTKGKPGRKITGKQAGIALAIAGLLVVGYVLWKRRQASAAAAAANQGSTALVPGGDVGAGGTFPFPGVGGGTFTGGGGGGGGNGGGGTPPPAPPPAPPGAWQHHCNTSKSNDPVTGLAPGACGWLWFDPTCTVGTANPYGSGCFSRTAPPGAPPPPSGQATAPASTTPSSPNGFGVGASGSTLGTIGTSDLGATSSLDAISVSKLATLVGEPIGHGAQSIVTGARETAVGQLTPIGSPMPPNRWPGITPPFRLPDGGY